ncbi:DNA sulfur modification protein DndB [Priestia megaterium]|uniref:DNA sulfur modification protein DndB n=1 Tax=Priestia megaterium TaxID=1404 RepID=UPI002D7EA8D1|nr:DNA sulfur modification protein DndB [Priestia megaterium]MEB4858275.1 DNA sulfur modification protein DndB [Priestia megaterium]
MFDIKLKGLVNLINGDSKGVMTTQITVRDLLEVYVIDNEVNRDINYARLKHISRYVESYDSQIGVFLPSLVFSFNDDVASYYDVVKKELRIPQGIRLKVIDGQHRIKGLEYLLNTNTDLDKREEILSSTLTAQIYFGLNEKNQKDVFVDINSNSKRVSMSLVTKYDTRDIMRVLVRDLYNSSLALQNAGVEFNKSRIVRPTNELLFTSAHLKSFITLLLFGTSNISKKNEKITKDRYDDILMFLDKLFTILLDVLPSTPGNVRKYALGHEALQNAIAFYLHKAIILEVDPDLDWILDWETEVEKLKFFDWSVRNPLFQSHMIVSRPNTDYEFKAFIDNKHDKLSKILEKELL